MKKRRKQEIVVYTYPQFSTNDGEFLDDSRIVLYLDDFELNCDESLKIPTLRK